MNEVDIKLTLDDSREFTGYIATVKDTHIGDNDHGGMTGWVHIEWLGGGIGLGGFSLDEADKTEEKPKTGSYPRKGTEFGMEWIRRMITTIVGPYGSWESLKHKKLIVLFKKNSMQTAAGVADLSGARVFIFQDFSDKYFPPETF